MAGAGRYKFKGSAQERTEASQVLHVLFKIFPFWSFQTGGMLRKTRVIDDMSEALKANLSQTDVGMAIDAGPKVGFGIVEMKGNDRTKPNQG